MFWKFALVFLKTKAGMVYYTEVDASANIVGDIYSMDGYLSDCVPIIYNNKLLWYTWSEASVIFYEINLIDYAETSKKKIMNGHEYGDAEIVEATCQRKDTNGVSIDYVLTGDGEMAFGVEVIGEYPAYCVEVTDGKCKCPYNGSNRVFYGLEKKIRDRIVMGR